MTSAAAERTRDRLDSLAAAGLDWCTFAGAAVELLHRAMPFTSACLGTLDPATELLTGAVKWGAIDDEHDGEWAYFEYEVEDLHDFRSVCRSPGGVVALREATGGDPGRSRRHAELYAPVWDYSDELRAGLRTEGANWGVLALFHQGGRGFSVAEQEFVASVSPALARGLRAGVVAGAADLVGGGDGPAVLVVGADDEVDRTNPAAVARIADLGGRPPGAGPLPQVVCTLVAAAARRRGPGEPTPRARLRGRSGRWIVAHASPLTGRDGGGTEVVVTLEDARPPEIVPLVVASYGLTGRERDVVGLVLRGVDTATIAATLHLSVHTVQDHLKRVFEKTGVRSRREVIARIYNDHYAPHLADGSALAPTGWFVPPARPAVPAPPA